MGLGTLEDTVNRTSSIGSEGEVDLGGFEWELRNVQKQEIEMGRKEGKKSRAEQRFGVLDVQWRC